jgi:hypothetical protein
MRPTRYYLLILLALSLFGACQNNPSGNEVAVPLEDETIDLSDFYAFYQRFHSDSLFQINHIIFPLKGLPRDADSAMVAEGSYFWDRDSWAMHKPFDFELSEYEREIKPFRSNMIQERIIHGPTGTGMIRRFAKLSDGEWHLIYYSDMNRLEQPNQ